MRGHSEFGERILAPLLFLKELKTDTRVTTYLLQGPRSTWSLAQWKGGLWVREAGIIASSLPFPGCATLGKLPHLSAPQFCHL